MLIERGIGVLIRKSRIEGEEDLRNVVATNATVSSQKTSPQHKEHEY
jgi:hypothetical protein